jgi:branched-chain amino acid transport system substrate-binding protein
MKKRMLMLLIAVVVVTSLVIAGCAAPAPAEKSPIKIGFVTDYTGFLAIYGPKWVAGFDLAFKEIGWEIAGRKIEVIYEDGATDETIGLEKAKKLVEGDEVDILYGPVHSSTVNAIAPYATNMKIPYVLCLDNEVVLEKYEYVFNPLGTLQQHSSHSGTYAYEQGWRTASIITLDMLEGHLFMEGFKTMFEGAGGTIVQEQYTDMATVDFGPYLANLKDVDVVAAWYPGPAGPTFVKQYNEYGFLGRVPLLSVAPSGWIVPVEFLEELGDLSIGLQSAIIYSNEIDTPANKAFIESSLKYYDKMPYWEEAVAYASASVIIEALKATGGDTDPDKIREAIETMEIETPFGSLRFVDRPARFAAYPGYIVEVDRVNGEWIHRIVAKYDTHPLDGIAEYPPK